jgi:hypothetical protein
VRRPRQAPVPTGPWILHYPDGATNSTHLSDSDFIAALRQAMNDAEEIETLYDVWERSIMCCEAFTAVLMTDLALCRNSSSTSERVPSLSLRVRVMGTSVRLKQNAVA